MARGPYLNYIKKNFTTRNSLGIEGVLTSMTSVICPIVNTVTPRAFYWPFMVWIYYDYLKNSGINEESYSAFDKFLKRQDYFFVLATLLNNDSDQTNLVGKSQTEKDKNDNPNGPYPFNPKYFKTRFGGMQYYNAGCLSMYFITDHDDEGNSYKLPRLTPIGEELAESFKDVIKDTEYYKNYRLGNSSVPREVLEEYGKVINIGLNGFDESKRLLKKRLFEANPNLSLCSEYLKHLYSNYSISELDRESCRLLFFDHLLPSGSQIEIPDYLESVSRQWEIVIGRQYFQAGLEMIWKMMLEVLNDKASMDLWIKKAFDFSVFSWDLNNKLEDVIPECDFDFKIREKMINNARSKNSHDSSLEDGIRILLSIYNWMKSNKEDSNDFLKYGSDNNSISLQEFYKFVEDSKGKTVKDFMTYIMKNWLINQHFETAFEKLMQGRDGFYYELIDGEYVKKYDFDLDFQGIRMIQLMQIMKDLDMFN